MKNYLNTLGLKSRIAFSKKINSDKKNKVLTDFAFLIKSNKKLILKKKFKRCPKC